MLKLKAQIIFVSESEEEIQRVVDALTGACDVICQRSGAPVMLQLNVGDTTEHLKPPTGPDRSAN